MAVPIGNFGFFPVGGGAPIGEKPKLDTTPETPPQSGGDTFTPGGYPGLPMFNFPPPGGFPMGPGPVGENPMGPGDFQFIPPPGFQPMVFQDPGKLGFTPGDLKKPGSLVVVDQFIAPMPMMGIGGFGGPTETPHGHLVSDSATGEGFAGNLIPSEYNSKYSGAKLKIGEALNEPDLPPEEFKKRLDLSIAINAVGLMDTMTERLEGLQEAGLHHSAVNLSYGTSQARALENHYLEARMAWGGMGPLENFKKPLLENYARAFDLDSSKLLGQDPAVAGPERRKLQQALADQVAGTMESNPAIKEARQHYETAVKELEKNHNSVVVSASNEGQLLQYLNKDVGESAPPLQVGTQFFDNVLATPETTVVGATEGSGAKEKVAPYSSNYQEVDLYANGVAPRPSFPGEENAQGTSFAAPKVAQVMAQLHELYPDKSSAEIESMLKEQLSHQLLSYDGNVERPVLNEHADLGMLSRYT